MSDQTDPAGPVPPPAAVPDGPGDEFEYPDPLRKVYGPGTALMVVGGLGVLLSLALAWVGVMVIAEGTGRIRTRADDLVFGGILALDGLLSAAACALIAWGGSRMRQGRSWGLSLTAAILALASFLLLGLCSVFILPFGVWALAVLLEPDVRREFERADRARWRAARGAGAETP
jgi:hypothetical protein